MPVQTPHADYKEKRDLWRKARDCVAGSKAIKRGGELYLPRLSGSTESEYQAYKHRALFYGASLRTVQGLSGAILRKPATLVYPEGARDALSRAGLRSEPLAGLLKIAVDEVITLGRVGFLVDSAPGSDSPYISAYVGETIVNWREGTDPDGRRRLTLVVLREEVEVPKPGDPFVIEKVPQYRVLTLGILPAIAEEVNEAGEQIGVRIADGFTESEIERPFYYQQIWAKDPDKDEDDPRAFYLSQTITPRLSGGRLLNEIPFKFINPTHTKPEVDNPPLNDLMDVNISHYMNYADLEHGRHYTALPTPWVAGFDPETTRLKIGSSVAWVTNETDGKAGMLEFTGEGLGHLASGLKDKEQLMAVLGARLLEMQKAGVEAADTVKLRTAGEQSALANIAMVVSEAFTHLLRWFWSWNNLGEVPISVELNRDFDIVNMDYRDLEKYMLALQAGVISWETWIYLLQRGEVLPDNVDAEEEARRIAAGLPAGIGVVFEPGAEEEETAPPTPAPAPAPASE